MTSTFGNEDDNFPFRFATKVSLSREQEEGARRNIHTENTLKLLGFPNEMVHGWKVKAKHTPVVSIVVCVCICVFV